MNNVRSIQSVLSTRPWSKCDEITPTHGTQPLNGLTTSRPLTSISHLSERHISWVWMELTSIYGTLFTNKFGVKDNGVWLNTLNTLTPKALECGVERLKNLYGNAKFAEFPPNCLQFKAICMDFYKELRLPSATEAYRETLANEDSERPHWSHDAVQYTASHLPAAFWAIETPWEASAFFINAYNQVCDLVRQGHSLPMHNMPLRVKKSKTPAIAYSHLQHIKQHLGMR